MVLLVALTATVAALPLEPAVAAPKAGSSASGSPRRPPRSGPRAPARPSWSSELYDITARLAHLPRGWPALAVVGAVVGFAAAPMLLGVPSFHSASSARWRRGPTGSSPWASSGSSSAS